MHDPFFKKAPAVCAALAAENISFTTFVVMVAVQAEESPPSLAAVAVKIGYSYWAVRNQVDRTPWFVKIPGQLVRLALTPDAVRKLERITKRLSKP